jgi:hypothetical protein
MPKPKRDMHGNRSVRTWALMRLKHTIFCVTVICAGCASKPPASQPSGPVAGLKPASQRAAYTSEQLGQLYVTNVGFGDWYLARLAAACDVLAQSATTPDARYEALRLKAAQGTSVYSILTNPSPIVQVLSLRALLELTRLKWVSEGKAVATFGDRGKLLVDALDEMQKRGRAHALGVISEDELNAIAESARRWRSANPEISDIEFIRFEDFATELARSLGRKEQADLMASVQSAASGLADTQLLGVRSLFLMSRFPRIMQWQLEAQIADMARRPETKTFLDDISQMARTAEGLKQQATQLQSTLESFPQKLADALTSEPVLKEAISAANEGVIRGGAATTQLAAVESSVQRLDGSVSNLSRQFEQINQTYDPASIQRMAQEGKSVAAQEARSLIYLITACAAGLVVLHALLRGWWSRRARTRS